MKRAKKPIDKLTDWEWTTLVASWRYYENRSTITSAMFPAHVVERFFKGRYSDEVQRRIAYQFAIVDHGLRGENDWSKLRYLEESYTCDIEAWAKFYRFCEGLCKGFHKVVLKNGNCVEEVDAFKADWNDRWYSVQCYLANPFLKQYCAPEFIVSIDGVPCKKGASK